MSSWTRSMQSGWVTFSRPVACWRSQVGGRKAERTGDTCCLRVARGVSVGPGTSGGGVTELPPEHEPEPGEMVSTSPEGGGAERPSPESRGETSRRRLLRTLVNAGYGAGLASLLDVEGVLDDAPDLVPVIYALARPNPADSASLEARETRVPGEWFDSLVRSFELRERFVQRSISGLFDAFVVPGDFEQPTASLSLTVTGEEVRRSLLDGLGNVAVGIDVSVVEEMPLWEQSDPPADPLRVEDASDPDVPGGIACSTGADSLGTLAPALYDFETRSRWFATSNHLYGDAGTKAHEHAGEPLYVSDGDRRRAVGRVARGYPNEDVVRARPVDGYRPQSTVRGASPSPVVGQFTRVGLAVLMARGQRLEKVGATSGHTKGHIEGIDGVTCYTGNVCKDGQLKWGDEDASTDGDSGSVSYRPDPEHPDEQLLVAGVNNARTWWPGADYTWGTAAYHLVDEYGLHF